MSFEGGLSARWSLDQGGLFNQGGLFMVAFLQGGLLRVVFHQGGLLRWSFTRVVS